MNGFDSDRDGANENENEIKRVAPRVQSNRTDLKGSIERASFVTFSVSTSSISSTVVPIDRVDE
jgi:hypothetical protein